MGALIDISVPVFSGMPFYPGDPGAEVIRTRMIAEGHVANLSELRLGSHTGTHIDAPRHFNDDGKTVDSLSLEVLVGPARVIDLSEVDLAITSGHLEAADIGGVSRLLIKTSNSKLWSLPEFSEDYVALDGEAAEYLVGMGIKLVGVDYLSIERFRSKTFPVHHALLGANVVVLEGIDLGEVEEGDYDLICLPLKIRDADGAPARVILVKR